MGGNGLVPLPDDQLDPVGQGVQIGRERLGAQAGLGGGLVQQVDGFVRQATLGQVAGGEGDGGFQRPLGEGQAVVQGVAGGQGAQDREGGLPAGFLHLHGLEAAL